VRTDPEEKRTEPERRQNVDPTAKRNFHSFSGRRLLSSTPARDGFAAKMRRNGTFSTGMKKPDLGAGRGLERIGLPRDHRLELRHDVERVAERAARKRIVERRHTHELRRELLRRQVFLPCEVLAAVAHLPCVIEEHESNGTHKIDQILGIEQQALVTRPKRDR